MSLVPDMKLPLREEIEKDCEKALEYARPLDLEGSDRRDSAMRYVVGYSLTAIAKAIVFLGLKSK